MAGMKQARCVTLAGTLIAKVASNTAQAAPPDSGKDDGGRSGKGTFRERLLCNFPFRLLDKDDRYDCFPEIGSPHLAP